MTKKEKNFKFRSKFEQVVKDDNRFIIINAFEKFCYEYDSDCAESFLWKLTYDPQISAPYLLSDIGLDYNIISDQNLLLFRNELRYQYQQHVNKNFLSPQLHGSCKEAFTELYQQSDIIVANVVYQHCTKVLNSSNSNADTISRILYLLSCDTDNMYFGGIRALGFDFLEAEYLKPFHKLIHDLLMEFYNEQHLKNITVPTIIENPVISEEIAPNTTKENPQFEPMTPENILFHKDVFSEFSNTEDYNILLQIGRLGFNLNQVMSKKIKIANFLKAAEALSK